MLHHKTFFCASTGQGHYLSDIAFRCAWRASVFVGVSDGQLLLFPVGLHDGGDGDDDPRLPADLRNLFAPVFASQTMTTIDRVGHMNYHHYY